MYRNNFTFNQKLYILKQQLIFLQCINKNLGIFVCPCCFQPMSLGRDKGQVGVNNYLTIHQKLGYIPFNPRNYPQVCDIHIDHINPCINHGENNISNAQIICSKCNLDINAISNLEEKYLITNPNAMEPDDLYWKSKNTKIIYEKIQNRRSLNT